MPTYVTLFKWTDHRARNGPETVERYRQARQAIVQAGGRILAFCWTQGAYDALVVGEWRDDMAARTFRVPAELRGAVRAEPPRALTAGDLQRALQRVP